jgi:hypothetical protein
MKSGWTRWCMVLGISALAACAREQPTAPLDDSLRYSITGHLRLAGSLGDGNGVFLGTRVLGDADGVGVELLNGTEVVARTTTVAGVYRFSGLPPGGYVARSWVVGDIGDQTRPLVIAVADVASADTLRLGSRGDLRPAPNPFADTAQVFFVLSDTVWVDMRIRDMAGNQIKDLLATELLPAQHRVLWNGRDQQGRVMPAGMYWVTYTSDLDYRAQLLFKVDAPSEQGAAVTRGARTPALQTERSPTASGFNASPSADDPAPPSSPGARAAPKVRG